MITIKDYIQSKLDEGLHTYEIARELGVSSAMISTYKRDDFFPSIHIAKIVYENDGIVLHPYSKESLKYELNKYNYLTKPLPGFEDDTV